MFRYSPRELCFDTVKSFLPGSVFFSKLSLAVADLSRGRKFGYHELNYNLRTTKMLQRASNSVHGGQHTSKTITSTKCSPVYVWGRVSRLHEYRPTQGYCGVRTLDFGQFEYRRIKKNKIRKPLPLAYRRCACTRGSLSYRDLQVLAEHLTQASGIAAKRKFL